MKNLIYIFAFTAMLCCASCTGENTIAMLEGLEISPDNVSVVKGESKQLELIYTPEDFVSEAVVWSSSNESVASVSQDGVVSAQECGEVVITAVSSGVMATCNVTVVSSIAESISLNVSELELYPQESARLSVTASPEDADLSTLVWTSSDESVAVVDQNGTVMAVAAGNADITATVGEAAATCKVTVKSKAKVGDFFYSDGTWSTDLDESKTVVGIVFYAGNPAKDDRILRDEHPECVNGLAVALTETVLKFQPENSNYRSNSGYSFIQDWANDNMPGFESIKTDGSSRGDNGNFMLGYNNTEVLCAFNGDEDNAAWPLAVVDELSKFSDVNKLPESTSGWFMPSIKELYLLCEGDTDYNIFWNNRTMANKTLINSVLSKVSGASVLGGADKEYWSSTEDDMIGNMCFLDFNITYSPGGQSMGTSNTVRFVFAF